MKSCFIKGKHILSLPLFILKFSKMIITKITVCSGDKSSPLLLTLSFLNAASVYRSNHIKILPFNLLAQGEEGPREANDISEGLPSTECLEAKL